jgi:hypothetical protein
MVYRLIAFFSAASGVIRDASTLRAAMNRKYRWMSE